MGSQENQNIVLLKLKFIAVHILKDTVVEGKKTLLTDIW